MGQDNANGSKPAGGEPLSRVRPTATATAISLVDFEQDDGTVSVLVSLRFETAQGSTVFFFDPDVAKQIGNQIMNAAVAAEKEKRKGLQIVENGAQVLGMKRNGFLG